MAYVVTIYADALARGDGRAVTRAFEIGVLAICNTSCSTGFLVRVLTYECIYNKGIGLQYQQAQRRQTQ